MDTSMIGDYLKMISDNSYKRENREEDKCNVGLTDLLEELSFTIK